MAPATQDRANTETNGEPKPVLFGINAVWLKFANDIELRRLAKLHRRIERKQDALKALITERQIMNRCIRRMRRSQGKN